MAGGVAGLLLPYKCGSQQGSPAWLSLADLCRLCLQQYDRHNPRQRLATSGCLTAAPRAGIQPGATHLCEGRRSHAGRALTLRPSQLRGTLAAELAQLSSLTLLELANNE